MATARCLIAPAYEKWLEGGTRTRYWALLLSAGAPLIVDQLYTGQPKLTVLFRCDHREHRSPAAALECAWQERARRGTSCTDPVVWESQGGIPTPHSGPPRAV